MGEKCREDEGGLRSDHDELSRAWKSTDCLFRCVSYRLNQAGQTKPNFAYGKLKEKWKKKKAEKSWEEHSINTECSRKRDIESDSKL